MTCENGDVLLLEKRDFYENLLLTRTASLAKNVSKMSGETASELTVPAEIIITCCCCCVAFLVSRDVIAMDGPGSTSSEGSGA